MKTRKLAGFTLIETLVVVSIMGVLLLAAVAAYNRMNDRAKVEQAAQTLLTQLRSWQKDTDTGIDQKYCSGGDVFGGLQVDQINSTTVTASIVCNSDPISDGIKTLQLKVNLNPGTSSSSFRFLPLGQGTSEAVTWIVSQGSYAYRIQVSMAGGMSVERQ